MKWINRLYIFFLGIILTITTGFGIAAFYPQPQSPNYLNEYTLSQSCTATPANESSPECQQEFNRQRQLEQEQQQAQVAYMNKSSGYTRTAIFFGIVIGAIFALLGIIFIRSSKILANGLLLGGLLTAVLTRVSIELASLGSSTLGTITDPLSYFEFGVLSVLSVVIIVVGYVTLKDAH